MVTVIMCNLHNDRTWLRNLWLPIGVKRIRRFAPRQGWIGGADGSFDLLEASLDIFPIDENCRSLIDALALTDVILQEGLDVRFQACLHIVGIHPNLLVARGRLISVRVHADKPRHVLFLAWERAASVFFLRNVDHAHRGLAQVLFRRQRLSH